MTLSTYFINLTLDAQFGDDHAANMPDPWFLSMHTDDPGATGAHEVPFTSGYGRLSVANTNTNFDPASSGSKRNAIQLAWSTASGSWGNIGWIGFWDDATAGNYLARGVLTAPITPINTSTPLIPVHALIITLA